MKETRPPQGFALTAKGPPVMIDENFLTLNPKSMSMRVRISAILILIATLFSCSKDNGTTAQPPYMNAKADAVVVEFTQYTAIQNGSNLQINGANPTGGINVSLSINNIANGQTGTFNIGPGNFHTASYTDATGGYSAGTSVGTGVITISSNTGSGVKGTFQFTGYNLAGKPKVITEGQFLIYY